MNRLDRFEGWLKRINHRYGAVGSVVTVVFWLVVLAVALRSMLFFH